MFAALLSLAVGLAGSLIPHPAVAQTAGECLGADCYEQPVRVGVFDADVIPEASGLAASARNPGVLYVLDDGPGTSEVWAVRTSGEIIGAITFTSTPTRDAESLAIGPCGPGDATRCVYVADIG
ncbi:MAG: hypothetical protein H0V05_16795, partial [Euzebyaceae bacterium]|nr:hypothetical protein [Euzebyaceae bacterium]